MVQESSGSGQSLLSVGRPVGTSIVSGGSLGKPGVGLVEPEVEVRFGSRTSASSGT